MASQPKYFLFLLSILAICLLVSCGGSSSTTAVGVGGANFTLVWQESGQGKVAKQVAKGEICSANGIDQIKVSYLSGTTVIQSQTFECSLGSGTVTGIPVGTYVLKVEGLTGGAVSWRGTLTNAIIEANKTTDHGTIMMAYVGPSQVAPSAGAHGVISPATAQAVANGATQAFTITPDSGYVTVTPIGGSCPQGILNGTTYTTGAIIADCTVVPTFSNLSNNVTPSAGTNGVISPATIQAVANGATKAFTITPNSGYATVTPIGGSCPQGTLSGTTYTTGAIVADCTVTPTFSNFIYSITPNPGANGSINPAGITIAASGTARQFEVLPDSGYQIALVTGCGGSLAGTTYTTGVIAGDCQITASFSPLPTYRISGVVATAGNVGIADVTVLLTGSGTTFATTDSSGLYSFAGAANGSYTLTPSLAGYTFAPLSRGISVSGADLPGQNFIGTPPVATYSISGTVTSGGVALAGVTVTLSGSGSTTTTTDSGGNYSFSGAQDGNYTLSSAKAGYVLTPDSLPVVVNGANQTAMNFVATADSAPADPSGLVATALSATRINLAWNDNAINETGYKIERATVSGGTYELVYTTAANASSYSDTTLAESTTYYYRVWAYNDKGTSGVVEVSKATPAAPAVIIPKLITVTGGTFTMGDTFGDGNSNELPTHQVAVSSFSIGQFEVSQREWQAVMVTNPSLFKSCGLDCPVENVSWNDVQGFITALNGLSGRSYRLPTEAEWEYAARSGGQLEKYSGSSDVNSLGLYAWYGSLTGSTHVVGTKQVNNLGINDMSGNVLEWVSDRYGLYSSSSQTNPTGPASGTLRVFRGGGWSGAAPYERTTYREAVAPTFKNNSIGFRLAETIP